MPCLYNTKMPIAHTRVADTLKQKAQQSSPHTMPLLYCYPACGVAAVEGGEIHELGAHGVEGVAAGVAGLEQQRESVLAGA